MCRAYFLLGPKITNMKKTFLVLLSIIIPFIGSAQEKKIDSTAVFILDHMSEVIGQLESCRYQITTSMDHPSTEVEYEKDFTESEVFLQGPDKLLIHSKGKHGHRGFYYDGELFTHYSYSENNYTTVEAPSTIISMIDTINSQYGVDFPAADFFYPTFTDDLLENFDKLVFLGNKYVEGKDCFHIAATNDKLNVQLWVANDAMNMPVKMLIIHNDQPHSPQYEATFTSWEFNPVLPSSIFSFTPPPGARLIAILPKKH